MLGIGTGAALEQVDPQAAETALAEAPVPPSLPDSYAAAAACARLMGGLLQHPPFPEQRERVAVAVGLQFLAVNGWQADLDPPQVAAIVVQCLAPPTSAPRTSCSPSTTTTGPLPGRLHGSGLPRTGSATPSRPYGRKPGRACDAPCSRGPCMTASAVSTVKAAGRNRGSQPRWTNLTSATGWWSRRRNDSTAAPSRSSVNEEARHGQDHLRRPDCGGVQGGP